MFGRSPLMRRELSVLRGVTMEQRIRKILSMALAAGSLLLASAIPVQANHKVETDGNIRYAVPGQPQHTRHVVFDAESDSRKSTTKGFLRIRSLTMGEDITYDIGHLKIDPTDDDCALMVGLAVSSATANNVGKWSNFKVCDDPDKIWTSYPTTESEAMWWYNNPQYPLIYGPSTPTRGDIDVN